MLKYMLSVTFYDGMLTTLFLLKQSVAYQTHLVHGTFKIIFFKGPMACYFLGVSGSLIQYLNTLNKSAVVQNYSHYEPVPQ